MLITSKTVALCDPPKNSSKKKLPEIADRVFEKEQNGFRPLSRGKWRESGITSKVTEYSQILRFVSYVIQVEIDKKRGRDDSYMISWFQTAREQHMICAQFGI